MALQNVQMTAKRLGVNQARVRRLLASGRLDGSKVGSHWVIDDDAITLRRELSSAARSRPLSVRTAWSTAAVLDDLDTSWLSTSERSRIRSRMRRREAAEAVSTRWWMQARASTRRYRVADNDIAELLQASGVVSGGISAANSYGLGLSHSSEAEIYTGVDMVDGLVDEFFLTESTQGNLAVHVVPDGEAWHQRTARMRRGRLTVPRLIVAVDLLDSDDTRSRRAGAELLHSVLPASANGLRVA